MKKRASIDRRQTDRRKGFNLEIINRVGMERRKKERRGLPEKRKGWVRVDGWISVNVSKLDTHRLEMRFF